LPAQTATTQITPYTAPEIIHGHVPGACTDIFSFGAVVYEMATGRPPFEAATPEELADVICTSAPSPLDHPGLEKFIAACLAKNPAGRWQHMTVAMIELKLLAVAERQSRRGVAIWRKAQIRDFLRSEAEQVESRWLSRFEEQQLGLRELQKSAAIEHA